MDEDTQKIADLTKALDQSIHQLKKAYNEYKEDADHEKEDPEALLDDL
ncbi:hypothetical protein JXD20_02005 [Candidatus Peregrinibacteria bacterium]|nr:hypothetical protein [Candidatus Peregrinibacteria bacterium]